MVISDLPLIIFYANVENSQEHKRNCLISKMSNLTAVYCKPHFCIKPSIVQLFSDLNNISIQWNKKKKNTVFLWKFKGLYPTT